MGCSGCFGIVIVAIVVAIVCPPLAVFVVAWGIVQALIMVFGWGQGQGPHNPQ